MTEKLDKIIAQVRTLLAVADGGSPYEAERELARERAERMMIRYAIDATTVQLTSDEKAKPETYLGDVFGKYALDQHYLISAVYDAFGCTSLRYRDPWRPHREGRSARYFKAWGFRADLEMAGALIDHLLPQLLAVMVSHGGTTGERKAFGAGWTDRVHERLKDYYREALQDALSDGTGNALVLVDRQALVEAQMKADEPQFGIVSLRRTNEQAIAAGMLAGDYADITLDSRKAGARAALALTA